MEAKDQPKNIFRFPIYGNMPIIILANLCDDTIKSRRAAGHFTIKK